MQADEANVWAASFLLGAVMGSPIAIMLVVQGYWYAAVAAYLVPMLLPMGLHLHRAFREKRQDG